MNFFEFKTHEAAITTLTGTNKPLTDYITKLYTQYLVDPFVVPGSCYTKLHNALNNPEEYEEDAILGILYAYRLITYAKTVRKSKVQIKGEILNLLDNIKQKVLQICHKTVPIDWLFEYTESFTTRLGSMKAVHRAQNHLTSTDTDFKLKFYVDSAVLDLNAVSFDKKHVIAILLTNTYEFPNEYLQKLLRNSPTELSNSARLTELVTTRQLILDSVTQYIKEVQ